MLYLPLLVGGILLIWIKIRKRTAKLSYKMLPLLLFYILITIDLGINFASNSGSNDGIALTGVLSRVIILNDRWTLQMFKNYYLTAFYITIFIFVIYCIIYFIDALRKE